MEGVIILVILFIVVLVLPKGSPNPNETSIGNNTPNVGNEITPSTPESSYARDISLGTGNAAYAYQTYEEYITINNRGRESINITNWQLKNGKDKRAYDLGSGLQYFPADVAVIPRAALFISPTGSNIFQDVILQSGEKAIITTGNMGSQLPYKITSFKENICSGYLEDMDEYAFTPSLGRQCPRPANEPEVSGLDTECQRFIGRMGSCHIPEFDTRDSEGNICSNCVDKKMLSSSCVAFIKSHFSYKGCIANHAGDSNFSGKTWRIFLGKGWEMWAKEYETISLFDNLGQLVDQRAY